MEKLRKDEVRCPKCRRTVKRRSLERHIDNPVCVVTVSAAGLEAAGLVFIPKSWHHVLKSLGIPLERAPHRLEFQKAQLRPGEIGHAQSIVEGWYAKEWVGVIVAQTNFSTESRRTLLDYAADRPELQESIVRLDKIWCPCSAAPVAHHKMLYHFLLDAMKEIANGHSQRVSGT